MVEATRYVLPVTDGSSVHHVELNSNGRVEVLVDGDMVEIINVPDAPPPVGFFPIYPGPTLVAFLLVTPQTYFNVAQAIQERWRVFFEVGKGIPTQYDNSPPIGDWPDTWAYVAIYFDTRESASISSPIKTFLRGRLVVTLHGRVESGDGALLQCADEIEQQFTFVSVGHIRFLAPYPVSQGKQDGWWKIDVVCPWEAFH